MTSDGIDTGEQRLRRALAGTSEAQRSLAKLELPAALTGFVSRKAVSRLRPASVLIAIVHRPQAMVMLTRRADKLRHHGGQISFPGGARDPGDASAAAAALRETQEEVGLDPDTVEVFGYLDDYPTVTGFRITPVVGCVAAPFEPQASPDEVAEVFEVPLSIVLDPRNYHRKSFKRMGFTVPYYEVRYGDYQIWGATAGMLWDLCQRGRQGG